MDLALLAVGTRVGKGMRVCKEVAKVEDKLAKATQERERQGREKGKIRCLQGEAAGLSVSFFAYTRSGHCITFVVLLYTVQCELREGDLLLRSRASEP